MLSHIVPMGWESGNGLADWFWIRAFYEIAGHGHLNS